MVQGVRYFNPAGEPSITTENEPLVYTGKATIDSWFNTNFNGAVPFASNGIFTSTAGATNSFPTDDRTALYGDDEFSTIYWPLVRDNASGQFGRDETRLDANGNLILCRFIRWHGADTVGTAFANLPNMDGWFFRSARPRPEAQLPGSQGLRILDANGARFDSRETYAIHIGRIFGANLVTGAYEAGTRITSTVTNDAVFVWESPIPSTSRLLEVFNTPGGQVGVTMSVIAATWFSGIMWWISVHTRTQQDIDFGDPGAVGDEFLRVTYPRGNPAPGIFDLPMLSAPTLDNINISFIDATGLT